MTSHATIDLQGIEIDVEFYYCPKEQETRDSPGSAETFEDVELFLKDENVTQLLMPYYESEVINQLKSIKRNHESNL